MRVALCVALLSVGCYDFSEFQVPLDGGAGADAIAPQPDARILDGSAPDLAAIGDGGIADSAAIADGACPLPDLAHGDLAGFTPTWTWSWPPPQGNHLNAVWSADATHSWAVGNDGAIVFSGDGVTWQLVAGGTHANLNGVWGSSASDVWAVGDGATLLHFDGTRWSAVSQSATTMDLLGVGGGGGDVYLVGRGGTLLRGTGVGGSWSPQPINRTNDLWSVWESSTRTVYVAGAGGTILFFDGSSWTAQSSSTSAELRTVWGASETDVWAAGTFGTVVHSGGNGVWATQATSYPLATFSQLWGTGASDVYLAGTGVTGSGLLLHWAGASWSASFANLPAPALRGVGGSGATAVIAAGVGGTVEETTDHGASFTVAAGSTVTVRAVAASGSVVWAVGDGNLAMRSTDGASWTPLPSLTGKVAGDRSWIAVWASPCLTLVASSDGYVFRTVDDGANWVQTDHRPELNGLWGSSPSDLYAVGNGLGLYHSTDGGQSWSSVALSINNQDLYGVWGSGPNDVFVVGTGGTILHFDGNSWTPQASTTNVRLVSIAGNRADDVYAVGDWATIVHYGGSGVWKTQPSVDALWLQSVWASGPNDVWAVNANGAASGELLHSDGSGTWKLAPFASNQPLTFVGGQGPGDVWVAGTSTLIHGH